MISNMLTIKDYQLLNSKQAACCVEKERHCWV